MQRLGHLLSGGGSLYLFIGNVRVVNSLQELSQPLYGIILLFPLSPLVFLSIQRRIVRSRVVTHPISHKLNKIRLLLLQNVLSGLLSCMQTRQRVVPIHSRSSNTEAYRSRCNPVRSILIFYRSRNGIFVIPAQKQGLTLQRGCKIQGSRKVTLTCCAFSEITSCDLCLVGSPKRIARPSSLWYLRRYISSSLLSGEDTVTLFNSRFP